MPRVSRVLPHLSVEEVQQKMKTATNFRRQQKWFIVYNALVDPRTAAQIALHTGTSKRTVHQVISDYNRQGIAAIDSNSKFKSLRRVKREIRSGIGEHKLQKMLPTLK